jgi:phosphate transport system substrate-binding protein
MKTILAAALAVIAILFFALGGREEASAVIAGSTSVLPYVEILAEEYARLFPDRIIDVQGGGSSAGIMAVESGIADLGMSSRELKNSEEHLWRLEIAKDGLAIITNPANPVDCLTGEQLQAIYAGDITRWNDERLGIPGAPDAGIHLIVREEGSGTRSAFEDLVMGVRRITPRAIVMNSNGAVRQLVAGDPNAIGFISLGLVEVGERPVKAVSIDRIAATRDNVLNESYALFREFLLVATEAPAIDSPAGQFIEFIMSAEGRRILTGEGLVAEERNPGLDTEVAGK